jgi:hypothetical protein
VALLETVGPLEKAADAGRLGGGRQGDAVPLGRAGNHEMVR